MACSFYLKLIVALGNPGKEYAKTRHNAGFIIADQFISSYAGKLKEDFEKYDSKITKLLIKNDYSLYVLKPMTYMNLSGQAVKKFVQAEKLELEKMLVIHDDMDINLGAVKFSFGAGAAGHNGVQSIITALDNNANFARLRIGIGKDKNRSGAEHVLSEFTEEEWKIFEKTIELSISAINFAVYNGISSAMNVYNKKVRKVE